MKTKFLFNKTVCLILFWCAVTGCSKDDNNPEINYEINYGIVTDIDGNTYKTVIIGTQTWMAENLKVTKYNDGTSIPNVTGATEWYESTTGALCDYENTSLNSETYGKLYNWYTVNTDKLCPTGWHVPTDAEWTTLTNYLGGEGIAGGKLKETGTTHWDSPNIDATNESGFTALPGGFRNYHGGAYGSIGHVGYWWSATEYLDSEILVNYALPRIIQKGNSSVGKYPKPKGYGFSVRCVKD